LRLKATEFLFLLFLQFMFRKHCLVQNVYDTVPVPLYNRLFFTSNFSKSCNTKFWHNSCDQSRLPHTCTHRDWLLIVVEHV
jgi:hypothetical protein